MYVKYWQVVIRVASEVDFSLHWLEPVYDSNHKDSLTPRPGGVT